jgi:predicted dehydrogenase
MGRTHAEAIRKYVANAQLVAVAGGSRAAALAAEYQVEVEASVNALLERDDIQAVIIAAPHAQHAHYAVLAAQHGKHVLVEKPMATTVKECDAMINACRKAEVNLMVAQTQRYRWCNVQARQLIQEGRIGKVLMIRETQMGTLGLAGFPKWQSEVSNVGLLIGHGIHNLDRMRWMTGSEVKSVHARVGSLRVPSSIDLSTMALMTFESGAVASLWFSWECPPPGFPHTEFHAWIMGEKGLLDLDAYGKLQLGVGDKWEVVYEQPPIDYRGNMLAPARMQTYQQQNQEFINSIRERRRPAIPGEDGRAAVEIAEAAYQSGRSGQPVSLPLESE